MLYKTNNPHGGDIYDTNIILDFSVNSNPLGTPESVLDGIRATLEQVRQYPDPYCRQLVQAVGEMEKVNNEQIICSNGAAELIYSYCEVIRPKRAVELAPTFSEYALALKRFDCVPQRYMLTQQNNFEVDDGFLSCLEQTKPEVIFLCNPNNPTGRVIAPSLLEKILCICKDENIRLFVDECFLDLSDGGESMKKYLNDYKGLFILKAFTKSYSMAGIRLGYGLTSDSSLLCKMGNTVQPWNVSLLAQAAGVIASKEKNFLHEAKRVIGKERLWLESELKKLGFWVCPSDANFLLFYGKEDLDIKLMENGIKIRNCSNYLGLKPGWFRIAVRLHKENEKLADAIKSICER